MLTQGDRRPARLLTALGLGGLPALLVGGPLIWRVNVVVPPLAVGEPVDDYG